MKIILKNMRLNALTLAISGTLFLVPFSAQSADISGSNGTDGNNGTNGVDQTSEGAPGPDGQLGTAGTAGQTALSTSNATESIDSSSTVLGGAGGSGGSGGDGGNGGGSNSGVAGAGGDGASGSAGAAGGLGISGSNLTINNDGNVFGGAGGNGGAGGSGGNGGSGITKSSTAGRGGNGGIGGTAGNGGDGISGSSLTIVNFGEISGGAGGNSGAGGAGGAGGAKGAFNAPDGAPGFPGAAGDGGDAIVSTGDSTINNYGTVSAGAAGTGSITGSTGNAMTLSGGNNTVNLNAGSIVTGNIVSDGSTDKLYLNAGSVTGDVSGMDQVDLNGGSLTGNISSTSTVNITEDFTTGGTIAASTVNVASTKTLDVGHSVTAAVANAGTLDLNTGAAVKGSISGAGIVNVNDDFTTGGTLSGTTVNVASTKTLDVGHSVTAAVANAGTLDLNTGAAVNGSISGAGIVNVNDDFTTGGTLSGTTVNVASTKTLDVGHSVTAAVANAGTLDLNTGAAVNGSISGAGIVNVNDDFTTGGTITADTVNIAANQTMNLAHNITAKTTNNAGTTSVDSGANRTISGNYTQSTTGIFETNVSNDATYGKLNVIGTATLPSNAQINVNVTDPSFNFTTALTTGMTDIISAGTLISDGTFIVTDNSLLFTFDAIQDADTVDLTLTADTSKATVLSATSSQGKTAATGAATVLDEQITSDPSGQIASSFVGLTTEKEVADAAESTLPGISGGVSQLTNISTNAVRDVISARQDSIRGLASGDNYFADKHAWFRPFGVWTEQDDRQGVTGYDINSYGLAMGIDGNVSTTWNTGVALAYIESDVDSDLAAGRHTIGVDSYLAKAYATKMFDDVTALNLQFGGGLSDYDSSRRLFTNDVADADYGSWQVQASAELERSYSLSDKTVLTPFVEADYSYVDVESYKEAGAGALSLNVDSDSADSLVIGTGVKASHSVSNSLLLMVNAGLGYDVMTDRSTLTASFAGGGAQFTTQGIEQDEWVYSTAVGATYSLDNGTEITARYDVDGREDYIDQSVSANVRWMF